MTQLSHATISTGTTNANQSITPQLASGSEFVDINLPQNRINRLMKNSKKSDIKSPFEELNMIETTFHRNK